MGRTEERLERVERLLLYTIQDRNGGVEVGTGPGAAEGLQAVVHRRDADLGALIDDVSKQAPPNTAS